jgi:hypothetical protein
VVIVRLDRAYSRARTAFAKFAAYWLAAFNDMMAIVEQRFHRTPNALVRPEPLVALTTSVAISRTTV